MAAPARRRRRWPWVLAGAALVVGVFAFWQLRSEKLARTILDRAGPAFGLELSFAGTPSYTLRPHPTLTLPGFVARAPGATTPLLTAERLLIALPWETIRGAESRDVTRVELDAPVLDLAALAAWQATRPDEPFEVPTLTEGLDVDDGTIVGDGWRLTAVDLSIPHLRAGEKLQADLAGRFERGTLALGFDGVAVVAEAGLASMLQLEVDGTLATGDDAPIPFNLAIAGPFDANGDDVRFDDAFVRLKGTLDIDGTPADWQLVTNADVAVGERTTIDLFSSLFDADPPLPDLEFAGHVLLDDALRIDLGGALPRWPDGWPVLPAPLQMSRPASFVIGYDGPADLSAPLRLRVQRDGARADVRAVIDEVLAWSDRDDASPLPPIDGVVETPSLQVGAFTLDGVRVEFEDGVPGRSVFDDVDAAVESSEADASP